MRASGGGVGGVRGAGCGVRAGASQLPAQELVLAVRELPSSLQPVGCGAQVEGSWREGSAWERGGGEPAAGLQVAGTSEGVAGQGGGCVVDRGLPGAGAAKPELILGPTLRNGEEGEGGGWGRARG